MTFSKACFTAFYLKYFHKNLDKFIIGEIRDAKDLE
jgi:hypothetical protein